jgi:hypothetical protein
MSNPSCDHDTTTYDVDEGKLARYVKEGADLLEDAEFGFASKDGRPGPDHVLDTNYWQIGGDWSRNANVNILVPKSGVAPSLAVKKIFEHPTRWSFDCSQFVQVVTFYGWLKLLGARKFDERIRNCGRPGIEIRPFRGSVFSRPRRLYWRERRDHWMVDKLAAGSQPRLTVREIVDTAPVGSRVMFRNDDRATGTAYRNENTVKIGRRKYVAHPFGVLSEDEVTLELYRSIPGEGSATLAEARAHVWIKEVDYYLEPRRRMIINATRAATRIMRSLRP